MEPSILIGAPIRNMEKTLPEYLEAILSLDYPKKCISLIWIVNDSTDGSLALLEEFREKHGKKYKRIEIPIINFGAPVDQKIAGIRYGKDDEWGTIDSMAKGKNILRDSMDDEEYMFYIEGDVIVTRDCLKRLLRHDKGIVGALVKTGKGEQYNILRYDSLLDCFTREGLAIPETLAKVDFISGPVLFKKDTLKMLEFAKMASGEDAAAMRICLEKKIDTLVDPSIFLMHHFDVR